MCLSLDTGARTKRGRTNDTVSTIQAMVTRFSRKVAQQSCAFGKNPYIAHHHGRHTAVDSLPYMKCRAISRTRRRALIGSFFDRTYESSRSPRTLQNSRFGLSMRKILTEQIVVFEFLQSLQHTRMVRARGERLHVKLVLSRRDADNIARSREGNKAKCRADS